MAVTGSDCRGQSLRARLPSKSVSSGDERKERAMTLTVLQVVALLLQTIGIPSPF